MDRKKTYEKNYGMLDGQKNRWVVEWIEKKYENIAGWLDRQEKYKDGWKDRKNVWIERKIDGWMDKTNIWMVGRKTKI